MFLSRAPTAPPFRHGIRTTTLLVLVACLPLPPVLIAQASEAPAIERLEFQHAGAPWEILQITNPFGNLDLRQSDGTELLAIANSQRSPGPSAAQSTLRFRFDQIDTRTYELRLDPSDADALLRSDLAVSAPGSPTLKLRTQTGTIAGKGLTGPILADTSSGNIRLRTRGAVRARSETGHLRIALSGSSAVSHLETERGDIEVWLDSFGPEAPDGAGGYRIDAETSGDIVTEFSLEIDAARKRHKHATAVIGDGSHRITLKSATGTIKLRRRYDQGAFEGSER